jgi:hypothetical protein
MTMPPGTEPADSAQLLPPAPPDALSLASSPARIEVTVDITRTDLLLAALRLVARNSFLFMLSGFTLLWCILDKLGMPTPRFVHGLGPLAFLAGGIFAYSLFMHLLMTPLILSSRRNGMLGTATFRILGDGLYRANRIGRSLFYWSVIKMVVWDERHLRINVNLDRHFVIPRRAFASAGDYTDFCNALVAHLEAGR